MYVTIPSTTRRDSDIEPFKISVADQSCATTPFTLSVVSSENRWDSLVHITMSDADFACLKEQVLKADRDRRVSKENALEALRNELEPKDEDSELEPSF